MTRRALRLAVSVALFVGWLCWLGYLAVTASRPVVLRRPQFLASNLDVVAELSVADHGPSTRAKIVAVYWPRHGREKLIGQTVNVVNLPESTDAGWKGPGFYILPLVADAEGYRVAKLPASPGFDPLSARNKPWIYPHTPDTLQQLERMAKPENSNQEPDRKAHASEVRHRMVVLDQPTRLTAQPETDIRCINAKG